MLLPNFSTFTTGGNNLGAILDSITYGNKDNMITIITDKLRNQTLEDVVQFAPISKTRRSWEITSTGTTICSFKDGKPGTSDKFNYEPRSQSSVVPLQSTQNLSTATLPSTTTTTQSLWNQPMMTTSNNNQLNWQHQTLGQNLENCGTTPKIQPAMVQTSFDDVKINSYITHTFPPLYTSGTPPDPPKKRHCRSLSIPEDSKSNKKWEPQASSIWKPVALRSHHGSNKTHHHSCSKLIKSRHSPLHLHHKPRLHCTSPSSSNNNHYSLNNLASNVSSFSPAFSMFTGNETYATPPESPVPRPASASSGFYDSSASQTSLTSLNVSWTEGYFNSQGCFSPHPPRSKSVSGGSFHPHKTDFKWERSLSVEEPISGQCKSSVQTSTGGSSINANAMAARSMPVINLNINSTPSSPRRNRVPRCRSQPCVLSERKMGLKRRRAEERPSINFKKMAETAYPSCVPNNRPKSVTFAQDIQEILHTENLSGLYPDGHYHVLDPIASSPLDTPQMLMTAPHIQVNNNTDNVPRPLLVTKTAKSAIPTGTTNTNTTEDVQWDSGCSDSNDPPDLISFGESENSCSFNDDPGTSTDVDVTDDNEDQQFQLEMSEEIDLDQIEKD